LKNSITFFLNKNTVINFKNCEKAEEYEGTDNGLIRDNFAKARSWKFFSL